MGRVNPDGTQLALGVYDESAADARSYGVNSWVGGVDGANQRLIATNAREPVFSPDGTRIAYIKDLVPREAENHGHAVETIATDGTDRRRLVEYSKPSIFYATTSPSRIDFSPDGSKLAIVEHTCCGQHPAGRIVIVDTQTGDRKRLPARVIGDVTDAVWSPNGRRIAFIVEPGYPDSTHPVFTIRPDGTGKRRAFTVRVPTPGYIDALAWQPRP